jgi:hypothetical protein
VHFTGLLALAAADTFGLVYFYAYCSMLPQFASVRRATHAQIFYGAPETA